MTEPTSDPGAPRAFADLLGLSPKDAAGWDGAESRQVLEHQLSVPLAPELVSVDPDVASKIATWNKGGKGRLESFGDLLRHEKPSLELLVIVKDYGKQCGRDATLPEDIATVLYYASIAKARVSHGSEISKLEGKDLREGLEWVLARNWIVPEISKLVRTALDAITGSAETSE